MLGVIVASGTKVSATMVLGAGLMGALLDTIARPCKHQRACSLPSPRPLDSCVRRNDGGGGLDQRTEGGDQELAASFREHVPPSYINFINFSFASSMNAAVTVVAPRSWARRSISLRAMG